LMMAIARCQVERCVICRINSIDVGM